MTRDDMAVVSLLTVTCLLLLVGIVAQLLIQETPAQLLYRALGL